MKKSEIILPFAEEIKARLERKRPDCKVEIVKNLKNNGVTWVGIVISGERENMVPAIYLESFYEEYQNGEPMDSLVQKLLCLYERHKVETPVSGEELIRFENVKQNLYYKLINYKRNEERLKSLPYIPYQDLAVVFCILVSKEEEVIASISVNQELMKHWGIDSAEELFEIAAVNTQRLFAPRIQTMGSRINEMDDSFAYEEAKDDWLGLYIATNCSYRNGASVLLYKNLLQEFSQMLQGDFFVLPSSVHELIFLPALEYLRPEELKRMVGEVNQKMVAEDEILSDSVYRYDAAQGCLRIVA